MAPTKIAVIMGAGPGTGSGIARAFAATHNLALLARSPNTLQATLASLPSSATAKPFACDATDSTSIAHAFEEIKKEWPESVLDLGVFSTGGGYDPRGFLEQNVEDLRKNLEVMVLGAFSFSQHFIREALRAASPGGTSTLIFSGATAALRGGASFEIMSPAKFGARSLSQSLAREFAPKGIHVAHAILDGLIDTEKVKGFAGEAKENGRLTPDAIGKAYKYLYDQDPTAWTQELDLRPMHESF